MINLQIEIDSIEDIIDNIGEDVINLSASDYAQQNETSVILMDEDECVYPTLIILNYNSGTAPSVSVNSASANVNAIIGGTYPQRPK